MGRLLAGLAPELSLLVSEGKDGTVSSSARRAGRTASATRQHTGREGNRGDSVAPTRKLRSPSARVGSRPLGLRVPPPAVAPGLRLRGPPCPPVISLRGTGTKPDGASRGLRSPPPPAAAWARASPCASSFKFLPSLSRLKRPWTAFPEPTEKARCPSRRPPTPP